MVGYTNDNEASRAFIGRVINAITNAPYIAKYEKFGGVDIKFIYDESKTPEFVGKPMILISGTAGNSEFSSAQTEYRQVMITALTRVTDFIGAQVGEANPISSDELLNDDLMNIVKSDDSWSDLGMLQIQTTTNAPVTREDENRMPVRETTNQVTFHYKRI